MSYYINWSNYLLDTRYMYKVHVLIVPAMYFTMFTVLYRYKNQLFNCFFLCKRHCFCFHKNQRVTSWSNLSFQRHFFLNKVFKQKSGKSVHKMQFLQKVLALFFDLNNLNGLKKSSYSVISIFEILIPVTFYSLATKK